MPHYEHPTETVFTWTAPPIKFGYGATDEIGYDLVQLGVGRCLVLTDPGVAAGGIPQRVRRAIEAAGITADLYDGVHVEPTDRSINQAVDYALSGGTWDGFVAVGGGSSIDTAKAVNLLTSHPTDLMDYIGKPIGRGVTPPGPLKPLIAVPTTTGTGSECTAIVVIDLLPIELKAGIMHAYLRPTMAIIDPLNVVSQPAAVTAASGMDVLTHALESFTARPYNARPKYTSPAQRTASCGANPFADIWCEKAMELVATHLRRAVLNGFDMDARYGMLMAATYAGIGFGNVGTHIPHACSYPISGRVKTYRAPGYPDEPLVPHGQSVAVTAPAALRYTFPTAPERHLKATVLLGGRVDEAQPDESLPRALRALMRDIGVPLSIASFGYGEQDIPALVDGATRQQRLLVNAPREVRPEHLAEIFRQSLEPAEAPSLWGRPLPEVRPAASAARVGSAAT